MSLASQAATELPEPARYVLVCQNRTCLKQGAAAVFAAFQATQISGYTILKSSCMGQCGNGPMIRVLPEDIWYHRVRPDEVSAIIQYHLLGGQPVQAMLYPKFHVPYSGN
jgi:(2Fe-2S) ferredoxin